MTITSPRNSVVKYVRSLARAPVRQAEGAYLVEGVRLVGEAMDSGQSATLALYDPARLRRSEAGLHLLERLSGWAERVYEVEEQVLEAAGQTETPAGVLAVLRVRELEPLSGHRLDRFGLVLDRLADPGNTGTVLRTADAVGVGYVVTLPGTVDPLSPKVVRAGMGAHFRLPIYRAVPIVRLLAELPETSLVALDASAASTVYDYNWPGRTALVIGSEAHGLSPEVAESAAERVRIPMRSGVESLNAAVAASIALYAALGPEISSQS